MTNKKQAAKNAARRRMAHTGETYAQARAAILAERAAQDAGTAGATTAPAEQVSPLQAPTFSDTQQGRAGWVDEAPAFEEDGTLQDATAMKVIEGTA